MFLSCVVLWHRPVPYHQHLFYLCRPVLFITVFNCVVSSLFYHRLASFRNRIVCATCKMARGRKLDPWKVRKIRLHLRQGWRMRRISRSVARSVGAVANVKRLSQAYGTRRLGRPSDQDRRGAALEQLWWSGATCV